VLTARAEVVDSAAVFDDWREYCRDGRGRMNVTEHYRAALHGLYDLDERLEQERLSERGLQDAMATRAQEAGRPDMVDQIRRPTGYEPAAVLDDALACSGRQVQSRLGLLQREAPTSVVVGMWPESTVNARAERVAPNAGIVYVNTGLIAAVRLLALYAASGAATYLQNPALGHDYDAAELRRVVEHTVIGVVVGADVRTEACLWLMQGPRDRFRRELIECALQFVIAHEYGHLLTALEIRCLSLDLRRHLQPLSESQVLTSQSVEIDADQTAFDILFADYQRASPEHLIMVGLGASLAILLQVATYYYALAIGSGDWGWSHPNPEIRLGGIDQAAQRHNLDPRVTREVTRFLEWAYDTFGIAEARRRAAGIENGEGA
jgi:hypothetical protein